jgi:mannan endo-1,4-beta-mannosidase
VYKNGFAQNDYDQLLALAGDKPVALGEVGRMPSVEVLRSQPRWVWFMNWGEPFTSRTDVPAIRATYDSTEALTLEELPWVKWKQPTIHHPVLQ